MHRVREKLDNFIKTNKVPHIIFHGPSGSGKRTLVNELVHQIYGGDAQKISNMTMFINCAHGKGIKFVREELNIFAKMNINYQDGQFKTIILSNADELTIDAQSALRRCIELYSHHTRFFVIIETQSKLLRPILSRFCEIYVTNRENLNKRRTQSVHQTVNTNWFRDYMDNLSVKEPNDALVATKTLYEKGYSGSDLMTWIEYHNGSLNHSKKYEMLMAFQQAKGEFRNERMFILFVLTFFFLRSDVNLESMDDV